MLLNVIMTVLTVIFALATVVVVMSINDNYAPSKLTINEHEGFMEKA